MLTTLAGEDLDEFAEFRSQGAEGKGAFRESLSQVAEWMRRIDSILERDNILRGQHKFEHKWRAELYRVDAILGMLEERPEQRVLFSYLPPLIPNRFKNQICRSCGTTRERFREDP
jgi:hypothetical protein